MDKYITRIKNFAKCKLGNSPHSQKNFIRRTSCLIPITSREKLCCESKEKGDFFSDRLLGTGEFIDI